MGEANSITRSHAPQLLRTSSVDKEKWSEAKCGFGQPSKLFMMFCWGEARADGRGSAVCG